MLENDVNTALTAGSRGVYSSRITVKKAFYFAAAGSGKSLNLPTGELEENYAWDVQVIDTAIPTSKLLVFYDEENLDDIFQKIHEWPGCKF